MRCPDCDYDISDGAAACPRCAAPQDAPAPPRPTAKVKWAAALLAVILLVGAGAGLLRRPSAPEAQVTALFAAAEGPCRHGAAAPCQETVRQIRALDDQPDASLLLADLKVADYLHTLPGGDRLCARWQRDQITQPELTAMGNVAYRKGLHVYRSLWISADIKRDDVAVPELVFGGPSSPTCPARPLPVRPIKPMPDALMPKTRHTAALLPLAAGLLLAGCGHPDAGGGGPAPPVGGSQTSPARHWRRTSRGRPCCPTRA